MIPVATTTRLQRPMVSVNCRIRMRRLVGTGARLTASAVSSWGSDFPSLFKIRLSEDLG